MGPKNLKTRHITLQYIQNLGLNELNKNYGLIYKTGQNLRKLTGTQFKFKGYKFGISIEKMIYYIDVSI